jgi:hypothetical protein
MLKHRVVNVGFPSYCNAETQTSIKIISGNSVQGFEVQAATDSPESHCIFIYTVISQPLAPVSVDRIILLYTGQTVHFAGNTAVLEK